MGDISTDLKQNEKRVREMIEGCDDIFNLHGSSGRQYDAGRFGDRKNAKSHVGNG